MGNFYRLPAAAWLLLLMLLSCAGHRGFSQTMGTTAAPPPGDPGGTPTYCNQIALNLYSQNSQQAVLQAYPPAGCTFSYTLTGPQSRTGSGEVVYFTVTANGNYRLTARNSNGTFYSGYVTVSAIGGAAPVATVSASGPTTFCQGGSVTLTASAGSSYLWSTGATSQSIAVSTSGSYSVKVTNSSGASATSATTTVTVNPRAVDGSIMASTSRISLGQSVTISSSGGSGTPYYWCDLLSTPAEWDIFQSSYGAQRSFTHTPTQAGTYRYHIRNNSDNGCGFCWESGGTCSQYNYVDVIVEANQTQNQNYVKETTLQKAGYTTLDQVKSLTPAERQQKYTYFDGLGRPMQETLTQGSPKQQDLITPITYDGFGRVDRTYLPYVAQATNGFYRDGAVTEQRSFYSSSNTDPLIAKDASPFAVPVYEASPLNRVLEQGSPGAAWQPGTGHTVSNSWRGNTVGEVRMWEVGDRYGKVSSPGHYGAGQLYVTESKDENGALTREYKDKQGRVVEKRVQISVSTPAAETDWLITQYVYDDLGNLRLVIQPEGVRNMATLQGGHGKVIGERWDNISGVSITNIPIDRAPDAVSELTSFSLGYTGDKYGARISGYIIPPSTGEYNFWIASDNNGELWLSSSESSSGKVRIASVPDWTSNNEWSKYPEQRSGAVMLQAGKRYYIEALMKEEDGGDNLSVGWRRVDNPNGSIEVISSAYLSGALTLTEDFISKWCFRYLYDARNRMVEKQVPGSGKVEIVYNQLDQPILQRNAKQTTEGQWSFTKFDVLGRPVMTGVINSTASRSSLQGSADAQVQQWEVRDGSTTGYTLTQSFPTSAAEADLLTVNYYDDYNYNALAGYAFSPAAGLASTDWNKTVRGQVTGSKTRVLGTGVWLISATFYDRDYRPLQTVTDGFLNGGRVVQADRTTTRYDFVGKPLETLAVHSNGTVTRTISQSMDYDHMGRLVETRQSLDGEPAVVLARNEYNELGQLVDKRLHSRDVSTAAAQRSYLQSVDYRYNIRGWLTSINDRNLSGSMGYNDDTNDLFGMELIYNGDFHLGVGQDRQFNGNIGEVLWQTSGDRTLRGYAYAYDKANRLSSASYKAYSGGGGGSWSAEQPNGVGRFTVNGLSYDANGNIKFMKRQGLTSTNPYDRQSATYGLVDNLKYAYVGNRLRAVDDDATATGAAGDFRDNGRKEYGTSNWEYGYDANGNMTSDTNKGITRVVYNPLNLPSRVEMGTKGAIDYTYTASGQRLSKKVTENGAVKVTDYAGPFVYEGGTLQFAHTAEGRALYDGTRPAGQRWRYEYHLKDHLGNLRVSVAEAVNTTYVATMEAPRQEQEATFSSYAGARINNDVVDHTKLTNLPKGTPKGVLRLNGGRDKSGKRPYALVPVKPGSRLEMKVYAKYLDLRQSKLDAVTLASALMGASGYSVVTDAGLTTVRNSAGSVVASLAAGSAGKEGPPAAYLKYALLDEDQNPLPGLSGYAQVGPEAAMYDAASAGRAHQELKLVVEKADEKARYVLVELSHESGENMDVYFDDMAVSSTEPMLVQENHYDPWGLNLAGIERQGTPDHKFQYNGKEKQEELGLNWIDLGWRNYDPQIGRFHNIDPMADARAWVSPFNFVQNNPMVRVDPDGAYDKHYFNKDGDLELVEQAEGPDEFYKSGEQVQQHDLSVGEQVAYQQTQTGLDNGSLSFNKDGMFYANTNGLDAVTVTGTELQNPSSGELRGQDNFGSGQFGARRDGGKREHMGIDILTYVGETLGSPIGGKAVNYTGATFKKPMVDITPSDPKNPIELIRMLYVNAPVGVKPYSPYPVVTGQPVGTSASLPGLGYPANIPQHVHVQVRVGGKWVDPTPYFFKKK